MTVDRKRLRELALAATPGPYFVGSDAGPHANSGLSLVDTGRREDWPIARLCESASAAWIAATDPQTILALLDAIEAQPPADDARIPREPTEDMIHAGRAEQVRHQCDKAFRPGHSNATQIWRAMYDAAERTKEQG